MMNLSIRSFSFQAKRWGAATLFRRSLYVAATSSAAHNIVHLIDNNNNNNHIKYDGSSIVRDSITRQMTTTITATQTTYPPKSTETLQQQQQQQQRRKYKVYLGVGSNEGDSFHNIVSGLKLLCDPHFQSESYRPTDLIRSSFLYHTLPMYVEDQASFWNGAVEITTDYSPSLLLSRLKLVEGHLGRNFESIRNGPRPLDLDILLYFDNGNNKSNSNINDNYNNDDNVASNPIIVDTPKLKIPHKQLQEREFVLVPLIEIAGRNCIHPTMMISTPSRSLTYTHRQEHTNDATTTATTLGGLLDNLTEEKKKQHGGIETPFATRLIPLPRQRFLLFNRTIIMGILNITPDSFCDGGEWMDDVDRAVSRTIEMIDEGADIIDIGGESTRPGASEVTVEEQLRRIVPVIKAVRQNALSKDIILSIDTRNAIVAREAIKAGADIINDVSGGTHDSNMLAFAAELEVPIILMHMRGTPKSMQGLVNYDVEGGVVTGVVRALLERSRAAEEAGIAKWMQILDPGIGFAKNLEGNLTLLKHYSNIRTDLGDFPMLLGTSRKGFIGHITGETVAEERDFGTIGSCVAALCLGNNGRDSPFTLGCNILRVHNVKAAKQSTSIMDAIVKGC